jgi:biopolymer transport protein ExbD
MRIRNDETDKEEGSNLTPLIDMVFLLLIFFLVATTFREEEREMDIQLARTSAVQPLSAPPQQLIINIREDGTTVVGGREYGQAELAAVLREMVSNHPTREVLVRADERSIMRYFANVAALCRQAGVGEVKVGYIAEPAQ